MMLYRFARKYSTRDIVEEYRAFQCARYSMGGQWPTMPGRPTSAASHAQIGRRFLALPRPVSFVSFADPSNQCIAFACCLGFPNGRFYSRF
jgi:hypothetical protein